MGRFVVPDGCVEFGVKSVDTGAVTRYGGRIVEIDNPRHAAALCAEGGFPANVGGRPRAAGWCCEACGFRGWFRVCGRCGRVGVRGLG